jgi:hypothetical protein
MDSLLLVAGPERKTTNRGIETSADYVLNTGDRNHAATAKITIVTRKPSTDWPDGAMTVTAALDSRLFATDSVDEEVSIPLKGLISFTVGGTTVPNSDRVLEFIQYLGNLMVPSIEVETVASWSTANLDKFAFGSPVITD